jgi:hypothetical protein
MRAKQKHSGASNVRATQRDADEAGTHCEQVQISKTCEKATFGCNFVWRNSMVHESPIGIAWVAEVNDSVKTHDAVVKRALTAAEIAKLEAGGSRAADGNWASVRVRVEGGRAFNPSAVLRCTFVGAVELGTTSRGVSHEQIDRVLLCFVQLHMQLRWCLPRAPGCPGFPR